MKYELINISLPSGSPVGDHRECQMSVELFQNARQTMGELRDILRETGISWDFIVHQIDFANHPQSSLENALLSMDPYTTGLGRSLRDLPTNVW